VNKLNSWTYSHRSYWYLRSLPDEQLPRNVQKFVGDGGYRNWPKDKDFSGTFFPKAITYNDHLDCFPYVTDTARSTLQYYYHLQRAPKAIEIAGSQLQSLTSFREHTFALDTKQRHLHHFDFRGTLDATKARRRSLALPSSYPLGQATRIAAWITKGRVEGILWNAATNVAWHFQFEGTNGAARPTRLGLTEHSWSALSLGDLINHPRRNGEVYFSDLRTGTIFAWTIGSDDAADQLVPRESSDFRIFSPTSLAIFELRGKYITDQLTIDYGPTVGPLLQRRQLLICVDGESSGSSTEPRSARVFTIDLTTQEVLPLLGSPPNDVGSRGDHAEPEPGEDRTNLLWQGTEMKNKVLVGPQSSIVVGHLETPRWHILECGFPSNEPLKLTQGNT
jgi:hypothetical protein